MYSRLKFADNGLSGAQQAECREFKPRSGANSDVGARMGGEPVFVRRAILAQRPCAQCEVRRLCLRVGGEAADQTFLLRHVRLLK